VGIIHGNNQPAAEQCTFPSSLSRNVALKVYKRGASGAADEVNHELGIYEHVAMVKSSHPGQKYVRSILDRFQVPGPTGSHWCLVRETVGESCESLQQSASHARLAKHFLRDILKGLLSALDYLHRECNVIHAGQCHRCESV
jgi:serine/threonine-protein kinase SRPK3